MSVFAADKSALLSKISVSSKDQPKEEPKQEGPAQDISDSLGFGRNLDETVAVNSMFPYNWVYGTYTFSSFQGGCAVFEKTQIPQSIRDEYELDSMMAVSLYLVIACSGELGAPKTVFYRSAAVPFITPMSDPNDFGKKRDALRQLAKAMNIALAHGGSLHLNSEAPTWDDFDVEGVSIKIPQLDLQMVYEEN